MSISHKDFVEFHFRSLQGMYFSEYLDRDNFSLLFSDLVEDSYYNYIANIKTDNISAVIEQAASEFNKRNRKLAIYSAPGSSLHENEMKIPAQFKKWAADAWMILETPSILTEYTYPKDVSVEEVYIENREEYVKIFHLAYAGDNQDDPYANLPEYYTKSLSRSFENTPPGFQARYVWAKVDGSPVGIGSMLLNDSICGIYGVGTIEKYRCTGVGASIMKFLLELNEQSGKQREIMLQTEVGSKVEMWYKKNGFTTIFNAAYYVADYL